MLTAGNMIKSIEISSSQSESIGSESSMISNEEGFNFPSKKKRIVRKKYKPRKKDVFIHTICVLNKNNFRASNSIIETFLIPESQGAKQNKKSVQSTIEKTNEQYLRKLMDSIKFTQNHNEKKPTQMSVSYHLGQNQTGLAIQRRHYSEGCQLKWLARDPGLEIPPLLPEYFRLNRKLALFK